MFTRCDNAYQDDAGQWWVSKGQSRTRAWVGLCCNCGIQFVGWPPQHGKSPAHCTRECYFTCKRAGRHDNPDRIVRGVDHYSWKGGRYTSQRTGYVMLHMPEHHTIVGRDTQRKYVLEHRVVMEQILGRNLLPTETIHHINGVKDDNRPENLQLRSGNHGQGKVLACLDCGSRNIAPVPLAG